MKRGLFSSFYSDRGSHYWHTPDILCEQYERTVQQDNCVKFENLILQINKNDYRCNYIKAKVKVHRHLNGTLSIFHGPRKLGDYDNKGQQIQNIVQKAA